MTYTPLDLKWDTIANEPYLVLGSGAAPDAKSPAQDGAAKSDGPFTNIIDKADEGIENLGVVAGVDSSQKEQEGEFRLTPCREEDAADWVSVDVLVC